MISRASPLTLVLIALSLVAFSAWDHWLDPANASRALTIRMVGALLIIGAVGLLRSGLADAAVKYVHGGVYLLAVASVTLAAVQLDNGPLWGTAGIVAFPALLSYYSIPVGLYLVFNGAGLLLVLLILHATHTPAPVLINVAVYFGLMTWLGYNAALVLKRAHWRSFALELRHAAEARTDTLTGLANRRAFDEHYERAHARALRKSQPLWLLMLDLDHFKRVNDTLGHDVGDQVLIASASALASALRSSDPLFRLGGEEFAVVLEATTAAEARTIAARLLDAMRGLRFDAAPGLSLTVSIGLAQQRRDEDLAHWQRRADEALYRAKLGGRNRMECDAE